MSRTVSPTRRTRLLQTVLAQLLAGLFLGGMLVPAAVAGDPPPPPPAHGPPPPAWDQLTAAQRELLIAPIRDRWNSEPERRQNMLDHARRWQELTPEQRRRARHGRNRWEHMNPEQRAQTRVLFKAMREMTPEQRSALKAQWRQMTPEQRRDWVERQRGEE
ncbi:DUF3106 domain-containing protein [Marilutibacter maris]